VLPLAVGLVTHYLCTVHVCIIYISNVKKNIYSVVAIKKCLEKGEVVENFSLLQHEKCKMHVHWITRNISFVDL
jgi:hypothetical protein